MSKFSSKIPVSRDREIFYYRMDHFFKRVFFVLRTPPTLPAKDHGKEDKKKKEKERKRKEKEEKEEKEREEKERKKKEKEKEKKIGEMKRRFSVSAGNIDFIS